MNNWVKKNEWLQISDQIKSSLSWAIYADNPHFSDLILSLRYRTKYGPNCIFYPFPLFFTAIVANPFLRTFKNLD